LQLLAERFSSSEIATTLYIGVRTVEFHVANILGKLGTGNRRDAVAIASRLSLI
jgi:two-component system, NarL family, response regulator LiaR